MREALLSVLIADDEYWIRESLRTALDWPAYGMSFLEPASDGEEALAALKSQKVDILITDINMPYLSGVELIRQAQSVSPQTAILVLSGYSDYEYVRQALLAGALDYLLKPISKASLLEALDKAIEEVLKRQREERDRTELQKKLSAAASAMIDRDFSELLHAARHQAQAQDVEAQLFEYEQRFSGYRLTLLDVPGASAANGAAIKELLDETISLRPRLIIRNLYHLTHYLLITPTDAGGALGGARSRGAGRAQAYGQTGARCHQRGVPFLWGPAQGLQRDPHRPAHAAHASGERGGLCGAPGAQAAFPAAEPRAAKADGASGTYAAARVV